jgi:hypothetical protein
MSMGGRDLQDMSNADRNVAAQHGDFLGNSAVITMDSLSPDAFRELYGVSAGFKTRMFHRSRPVVIFANSSAGKPKVANALNARANKAQPSVESDTGGSIRPHVLLAARSERGEACQLRPARKLYGEDNLRWDEAGQNVGNG